MPIIPALRRIESSGLAWAAQDTGFCDVNPPYLIRIQFCDRKATWVHVPEDQGSFVESITEGVGTLSTNFLPPDGAAPVQADP